MAERVSREAKAAQVRAALLDAALEAFSEKSYEQVSVDDIAARAGLTKGAVYSRFGSKAGLFRAAMTQDLVDDFETSEIETTALLDESLSVDDQLRGFAAAIMQTLTPLNPDDTGTLIADAESGLAMVRSDRIRRQVRTGWKQAADGLEQWVTRAANREDCFLIIPAADVATMMLATVQGLYRMLTLGGLTISQAGLDAVLIGIVRSSFGSAPANRSTPRVTKRSRPAR